MVGCRRSASASVVRSVLDRVLFVDGRLLTGQPLSPLKVQFAHQAPCEGRRAEHERFCRPLSFSAPTTEIHLPRSVLELKMAQSNPGLGAAQTARPKAAFADLPAQQTWTGRLARLWQTGCCDSSVTLTAVARRCADLAHEHYSVALRQRAARLACCSMPRGSSEPRRISSCSPTRCSQSVWLLGRPCLRRAFQRWTDKPQIRGDVERQTTQRSGTD